MTEKKCLNPKCDRLTYAAYCCGICRLFHYKTHINQSFICIACNPGEGPKL